MTTDVDVTNIALQYIGTRTTIANMAEASNEAIQASLIIDRLRDQTLRKAPWNCGMKTGNLTYITSVPGTPENTSPATTLWQPGQPSPPWAYEYQYPVDCLRPCWIIPGNTTGFSGGVPITTAVTGGAPAFWTGAPIPYKVHTDSFYAITAATVFTGGSGYVVGEQITLGQTLTPTGAPGGASAIIQVLTVDGAGAILTAVVVTQVYGAVPELGGSYFVRSNIFAGQGSTTGVGVGATFLLTITATQAPQRVILTNQEFATLTYVQRVTDPNVMDELFVDAWAAILGARLCMALTGDKNLANLAVGKANECISEARKADGNEGLTINNVTPDWIRLRGLNFTEYYSGPYGSGFQWGDLWPFF